MRTIKLNLRQNALHTLHHAIEHLKWSSDDTDARDGRIFDDHDHTVQWKDEHGSTYFAESTRPPNIYELKFALLHLIQAAELLLKVYVQTCDPAALFMKPGSSRTIDLRTLSTS
jgi:hypothetical protein